MNKAVSLQVYVLDWFFDKIPLHFHRKGGNILKVYHFSDLAQHGQTQQDGISIGYNGVDILGAHTLHGHDYYEMTYMCDGEGVQIINQKPYYV